MFFNKWNKVMSAIDDLNTAVAGIEQAVTVAVADLQALSTALVTALAAGTDTAAVEAAVVTLNNTTATLTAAVTANHV